MEGKIALLYFESIRENMMRLIQGHWTEVSAFRES